MSFDPSGCPMACSKGKAVCLESLPYMAKFSLGMAATGGKTQSWQPWQQWGSGMTHRSRWTVGVPPRCYAKAQQSLRALRRREQTQADSTFWRGLSCTEHTCHKGTRQTRLQKTPATHRLHHAHHVGNIALRPSPTLRMVPMAEFTDLHGACTL